MNTKRTEWFSSLAFLLTKTNTLPCLSPSYISVLLEDFYSFLLFIVVGVFLILFLLLIMCKKFLATLPYKWQQWKIAARPTVIYVKHKIFISREMKKIIEITFRIYQTQVQFNNAKFSLSLESGKIIPWKYMGWRAHVGRGCKTKPNFFDC